MSISWKGVFPAVTTQVAADLSIDLAATQRTVDNLVRDGIDGIIALGTVGENNSLEFDEKLSVLKAIVEVVAKRIPVLTGVSEYDTRRAARYAQAAEKTGADGLMLLPPMVYVPKPHELTAHFLGVAQSTSLPIMLYNNPPAYRTTIGNDVLTALAGVANVVALKESAPDTRRFTDLRNSFGDRYTLFAGLDDVALEGMYLGAAGWVSGLTNAFPAESVELVAAFRRGDSATALRIYRWFMPLLHLDAEHDLVQSIKLAEQVMGRGSERVLPPRLPLIGERRAEVIAMVEQAAATRPALPAPTRSDSVNLDTRTLSERVFEVVRERIVRGELCDGMQIRQDALAADLGVSKIPLREALGRLEQEGLIVSQANRGYFVQPRSSAQADEIFALRLSIEPGAAAYAATVASEPERAQVQRAYEALESAAAGRTAEIAVRNREFHTALVRPGGRVLTTSLVERLAILAERYVVAHLQPAGRDARAHREHGGLVAAWLARDAGRVETLLTAHIRGTLEDLRAELGTAARRNS